MVEILYENRNARMRQSDIGHTLVLVPSFGPLPVGALYTRSSRTCYSASVDCQ